MGLLRSKTVPPSNTWVLIGTIGKRAAHHTLVLTHNSPGSHALLLPASRRLSALQSAAPPAGHEG